MVKKLGAQIRASNGIQAVGYRAAVHMRNIPRHDTVSVVAAEGQTRRQTRVATDNTSMVKLMYWNQFYGQSKAPDVAASERLHSRAYI
jgi:hypothetical protein